MDWMSFAIGVFAGANLGVIGFAVICGKGRCGVRERKEDFEKLQKEIEEMKKKK